MTTVRVATPSKAYSVLIGSGLLHEAGEQIRAVRKPGTVMLVSDSNVAPLYADTVRKSCENAGFTVFTHIFEAGEASKTAATLLPLLDAMAAARLTRTDTVLALGGGVTGDMAGLAAALYMRGIGLVQLPTTLLAAVDSSVGGKTAIDLPAGKNLVGCFYQPDLVLCDPDTLNTLPASEIANGNAEIIKYAFLRDETILDRLNDPACREELVAQCVAIKRDVVNADERDTGLRQLLNFGHTFGHSVEQNSHFTIPHGAAVAIGMILMTRAAVKEGICDRSCLDRLQAAVRACALPDHTDYSPDDLFSTVLSDKKRAGASITLVLPERIGSCFLHKVPVEEARRLLVLGLEENA